MFEITRAQFERTVKELEKHAKEKATEIRFDDGAFYFFGSELATLRLFKAYQNTPGIGADYSKNLGTFYFFLAVPHFYGQMSTKDSE